MCAIRSQRIRPSGRSREQNEEDFNLSTLVSFLRKMIDDKICYFSALHTACIDGAEQQQMIQKIRIYVWRNIYNSFKIRRQCRPPVDFSTKPIRLGMQASLANETETRQPCVLV